MTLREATYRPLDQSEAELNTEVVLKNIETGRHFIVWYGEENKRLLKVIASQYLWLDEENKNTAI